MKLKTLLLLVIVAGGAYYWLSQNPNAFGGAGGKMVGTINSDVSKAEGKAKNLR